MVTKSLNNSFPNNLRKSKCYDNDDGGEFEVVSWIESPNKYNKCEITNNPKSNQIIWVRKKTRGTAYLFVSIDNNYKQEISVKPTIHPKTYSCELIGGRKTNIDRVRFEFDAWKIGGRPGSVKGLPVKVVYVDHKEQCKRDYRKIPACIDVEPKVILY